MANPRQLAVNALIAAERGGYSNLLLDQMLKTHALTSIDEAFLSKLFYGTIERIFTIHRIVDRYASVSVLKMKPEIRAILSVSVYQILFLDKVPDAAAVHEAVNLVKSGKYRQLSGFVNAVLRAVIRDRAQLQHDFETTDNLSFKYSCAASFACELEKQYGRQQAEAFLAASYNKPPVFVRWNTTVENTSADPLLFQPTDLMDCYVLLDAGRSLNSADFKNGFFHVEDKACQIACKVLDVHPGERVLDVCAAPGGKAFTLAQYLHNTGEVVACDLHPNRVRLIQKGAQRLKLLNIRAMVNDAKNFNPQLGQFDKILCDVPCSGYGVIRRKPEIKLKETDQFSALPEIQYQILQSTAKYLKKGGFLLYSTCTVRKEENDFVIEHFIKNNKGYKIVTKRQLMPQTDGTDGFFYCLLTR